MIKTLDDFNFDHEFTTPERLIEGACGFIDDFYERLRKDDERLETRIKIQEFFEETSCDLTDLSQPLLKSLLDQSTELVIQYYNSIDSCFLEEEIEEFLKRVDFYNKFVRKKNAGIVY